MKFRLLSLFPAFLSLILSAVTASAQERPVGYWRSHLPFNSGFGVATDGATIYAITESAFFTYNTLTGEQTTYSKVEGMHDIGMSQIGYDMATQTAVLAYTNGNIDLFRDGYFFNMPDILLKSFSGTKSINQVYTENGMAYLATSLGIVVLDLDKRQVKETYEFTRNSLTIPIQAFTAADSFFYAATPAGLYRARRNHPNLQAFSAWQPLDTLHDFRYLSTVRHTVFVAGIDSVFAVEGSTVRGIYRADSSITHLDASEDMLYIGIFSNKTALGWMKEMNLSYGIEDTFKLGYPKQVVVLADGSEWIADGFVGVGRRKGRTTNIDWHVPPGPYNTATFDIYARNGEVWVAHGAYNDLYNGRGARTGISRFKDEGWTSYRGETFPLLQDTVADFVSVLKDEATGTLYGGTMGSGLLELKADGTGRIIKQANLEGKEFVPAVIPATSMAIDQGGNLWVTQHMAVHELAVRTPDGTWYHYGTPYTRPLAHGASGLLIDDNNQKWFYGPQGGGVIVYNDNNTPENGADDMSFQFRGGKGVGNLPSGNVFCLAKDRDGAIWVGTDQGIGIINCAATAATDQNCEAELRVVQYDQFAGLLFSTEVVKSIAVDGANRKWIGTNNGVWLVSPDADKIIYRFTAANSPLPSDHIQKISIDPITGDVYIGTDAGLISFRSTATEGGEQNSNVLVFPNPVPTGYAGTIAIRGLVTDADVRITDITGQLVYRTKALGGQAVWNGLDYTGARPQTGVYLVFITNKDGSQTHVGKLMFNH